MIGSSWTKHSSAFSKYHQSPLNVLLHGLTTPIAIISVLAIYSQTLSPILEQQSILFYPNNPESTTKSTTNIQLTNELQLHLLMGLWTVSLLIATPFKLWLPSAALQTSLVFITVHCTTSYPSITIFRWSILFFLSYFGQDFAHFLTSEKTYQSTYQDKEMKTFLTTLFIHTWLLIPLLFDCIWFMESSFGEIFAETNNIVYGRFTGKNLQALQKLAEWTMTQKPPSHCTSHWWHEEGHHTSLPKAQRNHFDRVVHSSEINDIFRTKFSNERYTIEPCVGMNEVYVACETFDSNSDKVFYTNHVDGPYGMIPFARVYRCMVACTLNTKIETVFPMAQCNDTINQDGQYGTDNCVKYALSNGEIVGFDFNREIHRIQHVRTEEGGAPNNVPRICLKIHYVVYPKALPFLGHLIQRLTTHYNGGFRALFLFTIDPNSFRAKFAAWNVNFWTVVMELFMRHIGWSNVLYLCSLSMLSFVIVPMVVSDCSGYSLFLFGTSYAHYVLYLSTYHEGARHRQNALNNNELYVGSMSFGSFKRNVVLYKTLALGHALYWYAMATLQRYHNTHSGSPSSSISMSLLRDVVLSVDVLSFSVMVCGWVLAGLATSALGWNRTYFGWELGAITGKYVTTFPYGSIPHPMIVGGITAWIGFSLCSEFLNLVPFWLIPLHVIFYLCHMYQEHVTIYSTGMIMKAGTSEKVAMKKGTMKKGGLKKGGVKKGALKKKGKKERAKSVGKKKLKKKNK